MARYTPIIEEIHNPGSPLVLFKALKGGRYSFFLDSAMDFKKLGRYSFLGCDPFLVFKSKNDSVALEWSGGRTENLKANPFGVLKDIFNRYAVTDDCFLPFTSGGVGYFAYDLKNFIEDLPDTSRDDLTLPDAIIGFYDAAVICDNLEGKTYIASSGMPEIDDAKRSLRAKERYEELRQKISRSALPDEEDSGAIPAVELKSNFSKRSYIRAVERAKEYIKRGDIYQANLSQRFEAELNQDTFSLYCRLRDISPAPFSSYLSFGNVAILSSSPERFLLKRGRYIETRPIKGTRPRGEDPLSDSNNASELLRSPKDRAEHVMIVDLERNDLGRIAEYGSVKLSEFVILEKYSTVFHLVSTVTGSLRKDVTPVDCLLGSFPGGSITGAPKIRAMEIIDELEGVRRSVYTGAIGYISFSGNMDTSIVIRTFLVKDNRIYFQVGGGIVADSDPEREYEETLDKAKALMESLQSRTRRKETVSV